MRRGRLSLRDEVHTPEVHHGVPRHRDGSDPHVLPAGCRDVEVADFERLELFPAARAGNGRVVGGAGKLHANLAAGVGRVAGVLDLDRVMSGGLDPEMPGDIGRFVLPVCLAGL